MESQRKIYVLQGDMDAYDYLNFGVFTSKEELLAAAEDIITSDIAVAEVCQETDDFSGLVCYEQKLGVINSNRNNCTSICWDKDKAEAYLDR